MLVPGGVENINQTKNSKNYSNLTPMGRMAKGHEYKICSFFSVCDSSYMTGSELTVDGGWTSW